MLDVCLLGTGGMMPLPKRWLTSLMCRAEGSNILIDCGEGTQIAMKEKGWSPKSIDAILFTHFHADHISGLPGMLLSIANAERTEPLLLVGPKGLPRVCDALRVIAPELPFDVQYHELPPEGEMLKIGAFQIDAFKVNHKITCYGYRVSIPRLAKFEVEKAKANNVPLPAWNLLQHGRIVEMDGIRYTPDMVMGEARRGLTVTYCTDTRPTDKIAEMATEADLFICEGMYGDPEKLTNAKKNRHMMMQEAAELGQRAKPKEMWFTHYSPAEAKPEIYRDEIQKIWPVKFARDGWSKNLEFTDD
ncbi:MAG: ribonuclease Z [Oribacterium sp.]|nr:ribonuclease Z [Oribacterium sp.]